MLSRQASLQRSPQHQLTAEVLYEGMREELMLWQEQVNPQYNVAAGILCIVQGSTRQVSLPVMCQTAIQSDRQRHVMHDMITPGSRIYVPPQAFYVFRAPSSFPGRGDLYKCPPAKELGALAKWLASRVSWESWQASLQHLFRWGARTEVDTTE